MSYRITLTAADGSTDTHEQDAAISAEKNYIKAVVEKGNWVIYNTQDSRPQNYISIPLYDGNYFGQLNNGKKPITYVKIGPQSVHAPADLVFCNKIILQYTWQNRYANRHTEY